MDFRDLTYLEIKYIHKSAKIQEEAVISIIWVHGNAKWITRITRQSHASFVKHNVTIEEIVIADFFIAIFKKLHNV